LAKFTKRKRKREGRQREGKEKIEEVFRNKKMRMLIKNK